MTSFPKNIILRLLSEGLKSGEITQDEVVPLFPKKRKRTGEFKVPKEFHKQADDIAKEMSIEQDGLSFSVKKTGRPDHSNYYLYLMKSDTNRVAGIGLAEKFADLEDMRRAADIVIARYLESLE